MMVEVTWRDTGFLVSEFSLLFISRLRVVGREGKCSSCLCVRVREVSW